jgi:hypothetical protein
MTLLCYDKKKFIFPSEKAALLMHGTYLTAHSWPLCRVEIEGDRLYIMWVQQCTTRGQFN